jgi:D-alanine-D-alanine ligase
MNNKDLRKIEMITARENVQNILSSKKKYFYPNKIDKTIEIVIVPKLADITANQKNVGIVLDEKLVLKILSKRYRNVSITEINTENDLKKLALRKPDLVFSGVKYFYFDGGIIWLNDYLELYDISYIASNRAALHNEHDKSIAKKIMQKANIRTADFFTTEPGEHLTEMSIPIAFPLFIKPLTGGDSRGVDKNSIVYDFLSFQAKVLDIKRKHNLRSLVETYLSGKEYSVSILQDHSNGNLKAMPIEIVVKKNINGHCILDYDIKKNDQEKVIAVTDSKICNQLSDLSKNVFTALNGKSLGRIDIKMDHRGVPHFIEANLMPGLRKGYFYKSCLLNLNMSYEQMILTVADNGLSSQRIHFPSTKQLKGHLATERPSLSVLTT